MKNKRIEKLIYKSFDSILSENESQKLENELRKSDELRKQYLQIKSIRSAVTESTKTSFKPFFEERLINRINGITRPESFFNSLTNSLVLSFRRIAITAIIILIILTSYNLNSGNKYSIENLLGISENTLQQAFDPFYNLIGSEKQ